MSSCRDCGVNGIPRDQWLDVIDDGPTYAQVEKVGCYVCHRLTDPWYGGWLDGKWRFLCADHRPEPEPEPEPEPDGGAS